MEKKKKYKGSMAGTIKCPNPTCGMLLEGRWERGALDRTCYYCGKEFTLNEVSKLQKKSRHCAGQSDIAGRHSHPSKTRVSTVQLPVHDLRVPQHDTNTNDSDCQGEVQEDRQGSDGKEVERTRTLPVDPSENLRKVLERLKNG